MYECVSEETNLLYALLYLIYIYDIYIDWRCINTTQVFLNILLELLENVRCVGLVEHDKYVMHK